MTGKRFLIVGGVAAALMIPAGVAVAATTSPSPAPSTTQPAGPGYGPGPGMRGGGPGNGPMGGYGDPEDCPYYNSAEAQAWRDGREARQKLSVEERQKLAQQHREQMWQLRQGTGTSS